MGNIRKTFFVLTLCLSGLYLTGCSLLKEKKDDGDLPINAKTLGDKPLPPEKTKELLKSTGESWLYGQGIGNTAITVGGVVLFPPYLVVVLGNGILNVAGYESIGVSSFLPEPAAESWRTSYDNVASGPGRFAAAIAGREYQTREIIKENVSNILRDDSRVMASQRVDISENQEIENQER